ncbi:MFS transporter [Microbacterium invictum]
MTSAPRTSLWRNTRYVLWLISDTSKGLSGSLANFAIPLIALFVTEDPVQAGVIAAVGQVVRLIVTLYGGVLADRHGRIGLMLIGALTGAVLAGGFTLLILGDALAFTTILLAEVLLMIRAGLYEPASESALKELVPAETMGRAQAANQGRDAVLQLAGGPIGGALLAVGAWLVGAVMTACYAVSAITTVALRRSARRAGIVDGPVAGEVDAAASTPSTPNAWAEIREGFRWLFSRPDLGGILVIVTIVNLGFSAVTTTVIYSLQQSGHSALTIGWVSSGLGVVMLVGALIAPALVPRFGAGILTIVGLTVATAGAAVVSMIENPWGIVATLGAAVFLVPALNASLMGYFMVATPTQLLGRANSAAGVLGMGAMPLAPLIAGVGLAYFGRPNTILFAAGLCAVAVVLAIGNRALRALPSEAGWAAHAKQFELR